VLVLVGPLLVEPQAATIMAPTNKETRRTPFIFVSPL
jgi:hypothetical protein